MKKKRAPRRDDPVDRARTIYWFQYLAKCVGSFRPRDVQRAIYPMPTTDALGGIIKNSRFLEYSRGDHVPNVAMVEWAANAYPDSARLLNHVVWDVLRAENLLGNRPRHWIGQLDPDIQKAVIKPGNEFRDNSRTCEMLVRRFGLDSLAALTILFRLNHKGVQGDEGLEAYGKTQAWLYACGIFEVLMMMESQFITNELRNYIFELFNQRVFSLVTSFWGVRMDLENYDYPKMSSLLREKAKSLRIYIHSPMSRDELSRISKLIEIPLVSVNSV